MSASGRFCCKSPLLVAGSSDSVVVTRFAAEAGNDGAAQAGPPRPLPRRRRCSQTRTDPDPRPHFFRRIARDRQRVDILHAWCFAPVEGSVSVPFFPFWCANKRASGGLETFRRKAERQRRSQRQTE